MSATQLNPTEGYIANPLFNALVPNEGPKGIPVRIPFSTAPGPYAVDFQQATAKKLISVIQSCWIDNSANASSVQITQPLQQLEIPPFSQGMFPLLAGQIPRFIFNSVGTADVLVTFLNVPMPYVVWSPSASGTSVVVTNTVAVDVVGGTIAANILGTVPVAGTVALSGVGTIPVTGTVGIAGTVPVTGTMGITGTIPVNDVPVSETFIAGAHSIAAGGSAITVFASGIVQNGAWIANPQAASETLFVDPVNNATTVEASNGTNFALAPGQTLNFGRVVGPVTANAISAGHTFNAVRF